MAQAYRRLCARSRSLDFYREYKRSLAALGVKVEIHPVPVEVKEPIPFAEDVKHASYDPQAAHTFWRILLQADRVLQQFSSRFVGKVSPVHFFWGSFDLAVTRFSGRPAPPREGADAITREAYSQEVISAGFFGPATAASEKQPSTVMPLQRRRGWKTHPSSPQRPPITGTWASSSTYTRRPAHGTLAG